MEYYLSYFLVAINTPSLNSCVKKGQEYFSIMFDSYHIYFKGEILFKNLSKDEFEFVWGKLYTSYINALNDELTFEIISENSLKESVHNLEPSY